VTLALLVPLEVKKKRLRKKIKKYTEQYGLVMDYMNWSSANIILGIEKLKIQEDVIDNELKTMRDALETYIKNGERENELAKSLDRYRFDGKELELNLSELYHKYNAYNFSTRAQNCATITSHDSVLTLPQVDSIKQIIVSELDNKINNINTLLKGTNLHLAKLSQSSNVVHQLLHQVIDNITSQNIKD